MLYFVGGAPRVGKTILAQQLCAHLGVGWLSTDLLLTLLDMTNVEGIKAGWNAAPHAITTNAEWFFPYLERVVWGVTSLAEHYVIEGVDFLPTQVAQLAAQYPLRAVFLGCSRMTLKSFDQFPGRSPGYAALPEARRRQIAEDVPRWSTFIRQEAERFSYPYIDTVSCFPDRLAEAEAVLTSGI
jgi:2-phosphoglycerate kinase